MNNVAVALEQIKSLTAMEIVELSKELKEAFGITDAMFCGPQAAVATGPGAVAEPTAEKTKFDVVMTACGESKVAVIKVVREMTGLGLKEAKDMVEAASSKIKTDISKQEAEEAVKKLKEAGATCEIK